MHQLQEIKKERKEDELHLYLRVTSIQNSEASTYPLEHVQCKVFKVVLQN